MACAPACGSMGFQVDWVRDGVAAERELRAVDLRRRGARPGPAAG